MFAACRFISSRSTNSSACMWVASSTTGHATPASSDCFHRVTHTHHLSPGLSPGNPNIGNGVERSFPTCAWCARNSAVTRQHTVCCHVTAEFLAHQAFVGNDLSTPFPMFGFPGLKPGDRWCVCVTRWKQSLDAGVACPVVLEATHMHALEFVDLEDLKRHAANIESGA